MNPEQKRLLLEVEFHFYRLGNPTGFERLLVRLGYKPNPDLQKLDDAALTKLNFRLRTVLRQPQP